MKRRCGVVYGREGIVMNKLSSQISFWFPARAADRKVNLKRRISYAFSSAPTITKSGLVVVLPAVVTAPNPPKKGPRTITT